MKRILTLMIAAAWLGGCGDGSNPFDGTSGSTDPIPDGTTNAIPEVLAKNLQSVTFTPARSGNPATLAMVLTALDEDPLIAEYTRTPSLDVEGYLAFSVQNDSLDRHFTALVAESQDSENSVRAGSVGDGGQFNYYYSGAFYERDGDFSRPVSARGLVSYAGKYAGTTNLDGNGAALLPVAAGVDPSLRPAQAERVSGDIFINVDFNDNAVNGAVYNRQLVDRSTAIPNIVLVKGIIDNDGVFLGSVEYDSSQFDDVVGGTIGAFGGIFGGTESTAVGGIVTLTEFDGPEGAIDGEEETGAFVLVKCGTVNEDPICSNVNY